MSGTLFKTYYLLLQSLLQVLKESHKTRTAFRKVGGFVYVMSVLVSMEGALADEPKAPWTAGRRFSSVCHTVDDTILTNSNYHLMLRQSLTVIFFFVYRESIQRLVVGEADVFRPDDSDETRTGQCQVLCHRGWFVEDELENEGDCSFFVYKVCLNLVLHLYSTTCLASEALLTINHSHSAPSLVTTVAIN